jgi:hypothetical protein
MFGLQRQHAIVCHTLVRFYQLRFCLDPQSASRKLYDLLENKLSFLKTH